MTQRLRVPDFDERNHDMRPFVKKHTTPKDTIGKVDFPKLHLPVADPWNLEFKELKHLWSASVVDTCQAA